MNRMLQAVALILAMTAPVLPGADIPPYYPPPGPLPPRDTTVTQAEIRFTLPDGTIVEPGKFRQSRSLNGDWKISGLERSAHPFPDETKTFESPEFDDSSWDSIKVPLDWYRKYPKTYKRDEPYVRGFYRRTLDLAPEDLSGRRILLNFKFIGYEADLWINGRRAGNHHGEFIPAQFDITDFVKPGKNRLLLRVITDFGSTHGTVPQTRHTYGAQFGPENIRGGIWGDAELRLEPAIRVSKQQITPELDDNTAIFRFTIDNSTGKPVEAELGAAVSTALKTEPNRVIGSAQLRKTLQPGSNPVELTLKLDNPVRWSPDNPYLYYGTVFLKVDGQLAEARSERFGYRRFTIKDGKFHLNGERLYLFGENIPTTFHGGFGRSGAEEKNLFYERFAGYRAHGYNLVRTAHMPIMEEALDIADEVGLMIYSEWGWSFTRDLDFTEFQKRNDPEFLAWLDRDFNHPSVVMWSCGNEVPHTNDKAVREMLNHQVKLMRDADAQKRPAVSCSGNATWKAFGAEPCETDVLDLHTYIGNSEFPWTHWKEYFESCYQGTLRQYVPETLRLDRPYIIWETVGYSWGGHSDPNFKLNDIDAYADYVKRPHTWAMSYGVGHIGTLGLAAAVDPKRGLEYAKRLYGHRLLEMTRQDPRVDGFAPWFHRHNFDAATLWNQPLFIGLRNAQHLPPRNFFSDREAQFEFFTVNSTANSFPGGKLTVTIQLDAERAVDIATEEVGEVAPFSLAVRPIRFAIPPEARGNVQLRLTLRRDGEIVSRNFYNIFIKDRSELTRPLPAPAAPVALLDVGSRTGLDAVARMLEMWQVKFDVIDARSIPPNYRTAIVPPGLDNPVSPQLNRDALFRWIADGGTLLVLEQNFHAESLLSGTRLIRAANTLVDLVHPAHPLFKGLTPANFDTWENPEYGYAVTTTLAPFLRNAIAVRGAMNGSIGVENAILEATFGKGHLLWSQLDAVKLRDSDSVAATYLRNVFEYALAGNWYDKVQPLAPEQNSKTRVRLGNLESIDLAAVANRGFSDDVDNDGEGGWTDQGTNDFRNVPLGRQFADGIPFEIIDPAKNNGRSCLVLQGTERPSFPAEITGIRIGRKFSRIFFLHTAAWSGGAVGAYRFHYADGTEADYPLRHGINIGDWWSTSYLTGAAPGIMCANATKSQVGTYVAIWENPHPELEIVSMDMLSVRSKLNRAINFMPNKRAVPVLLAATGEKSNPAAVIIDGKCGGGGKDPALKASVTEVEAPRPDGTTGKVRRIEMPGPIDHPAKAPYAAFWFDVKDKKLADYQYLTLWIHAETSGTIDLVLPQTDWKGTLQKSVDLTAGEWQRIRVDLDAIGKPEFLKAKKELRGELFLFNGSDTIRYPRPPVRFLVTGIMLE